MAYEYVNAAFFTVRSLTHHNSRHINTEKLLDPVQRFYRNLNLKIFTKRTNCGGNCITGNVVRVWRMWRGKVQILRRLSAQEHDTYRTIRVSALLWNLSFTKYIWMYLYMI